MPRRFSRPVAVVCGNAGIFSKQFFKAFENDIYVAFAINVEHQFSARRSDDFVAALVRHRRVPVIHRLNINKLYEKNTRIEDCNGKRGVAEFRQPVVLAFAVKIVHKFLSYTDL